MNGGDCFHSADLLEISVETDEDLITGVHTKNGVRNVGKGEVTMFDLYEWSIGHRASFIRRYLSMGSNGGTPDTTQFPLKYYIDYVRVYQ